MKTKKILRFNICQLAEEIVAARKDVEDSAVSLNTIEREIQELHTADKKEDFVNKKLSLLLKKQQFVEGMGILEWRLNELEKKSNTLLIIDGAIQKFPDLIRKAYPQMYYGKAIAECMNEKSQLPYTYTEEYVDYLYDLLLRCWFSSGPNKVYDKDDRSHYNSDKMGLLLDNYAFPNGDWFEQLLYTLHTGEQAEWSELLRLTDNHHMELVSSLLGELQSFIVHPANAA